MRRRVDATRSLRPAAEIRLQQVTNRKQTDRGDKKLQHLAERDRFAQLRDDRQRRDREASQLQQSSERNHAGNRTIGPRTSQVATDSVS